MSSAKISRENNDRNRKQVSGSVNAKNEYRSKYDADFDEDENILIYNTGNVEDDYDDCKDIVDELRKTNEENSRSSYNTRSQACSVKPLMEKNTENGYGKRTKNRENNSIVEESPKKRTKIPEFKTPNGVMANDKGSEKLPLAKNVATNLAVSSFKSRFSPRKQRSSSLCEPVDTDKKKFASTPKSERKAQSRIKQVVDSAAYERNLSTSWADIIEEIEEQTKELNEYIEKVVAKYKLEKEELVKNLECDTELLRKRTKQINFGKITNEYKRYATELSKKDRKPFHPRTPNKFRKCSRRKFDGLVRKWRKLLHVWDENPDDLVNYRNSIDDADYTDDFGYTSNITGSNISYIVDDYDIIDEDESIEKK